MERSAPVTIPIQYGESLYPLKVPKGNLGLLIKPHREERPPERTNVLQEALQHYIGDPGSLIRFQEARRILCLVNDATRPTPTPSMLYEISPLPPGTDVRYIVATGAHRPPSERELQAIFGRHLPAVRSHLLIHDARKSPVMQLGSSRFGNLLEINAAVREADALLILSSIEPHYHAGVTGGRKSIFPGLGSFAAIERNHRLAMEPGSAPLALQRNPVHEEMEDALSFLEGKSILAFMTIQESHGWNRESSRAKLQDPDPFPGIAKAVFGEIKEAFKVGAEQARSHFGVSVEEQAEIVVTVAPFPLGKSLYQAHKAIENTKGLVKDGGFLILVAPCQEGIGGTKFIELLALTRNPEEILKKIKRNYHLGDHKAAKLAQLATQVTVALASRLDPEVLNPTPILPYPDPQKALDSALSSFPSGKIHIVLDGGSTIPLLR